MQIRLSQDWNYCGVAFNVRGNAFSDFIIIDLQNACRIALSKARGPLHAADVLREKVKKKNYLRGKMKLLIQ